MRRRIHHFVDRYIENPDPDDRALFHFGLPKENLVDHFFRLGKRKGFRAKDLWHSWNIFPITPFKDWERPIVTMDPNLFEARGLYRSIWNSAANEDIEGSRAIERVVKMMVSKRIVYRSQNAIRATILDDFVLNLTNLSKTKQNRQIIRYFFAKHGFPAVNYTLFWHYKHTSLAIPPEILKNIK